MVTGSDIVADSHTDIDIENAMLQSADSALYGKKKSYNNRRFDVFKRIYQNKNIPRNSYL